jgi:hypothetical protein
MFDAFMNDVPKPERTLGIYLVILYGVLSMLSSVTLMVVAPEFFLNPANAPLNVSMPIITLICLVGLWLMKKWGAILMTTITGIGAVILLMNLSYMYLFPEEVEALNPPPWFWDYSWIAYSITLVLNTVVAVYLFRWIRAKRFG